MTAPHHPNPYPHPARLILILSLAPTIGLGIGRFAYALVLPDMRDSLSWSYSAAGFMNTINAVGYLTGLTASPLIKRFGLVPSVIWGTATCVASLALCAHRQFHRAQLCVTLHAAAAGFVGGGALTAANPPRANFARPVLCRTRQRHPRLRMIFSCLPRTGVVVDRVVGADGARSSCRAAMLAPLGGMP